MRICAKYVLGSFLIVGLFVGCGDANEPSPTEIEDDLGSELQAIPPIAAAPQMDNSDQLLHNGDMEIANQAWSKYSHVQEGYHLGYTTDEYVSPSQSGFITSEWDHGDNVFAIWRQTIRVENPSDMKFTLTAKVKLDSVTGEGVAIAIRGDDANQDSGMAEAFASTQGRVDLTGTADWQDVQVSLQDMESDIVTIVVFVLLLPHATGTVYFDDVVLSATGATPIMSLQNGSVEGGVSFPEYWWAGGYTGFERSWSTAYSVSPTHSLAINNVSASEGTFGFWGQVIRADEYLGESITLTASVLSEAVRGEGIAIAIRTDNTIRPQGMAEAFATTQGNTLIAGGAGWNRYSVTLDNVPADSKSITIYLIYLPGTSGTAYFDDISLGR